MTNFIPIFPLGIVVYPGEQLNLHIFEPRYKQLITECFENKKPFGIPPVIDNKLNETGTLVKVIEITKLYDDGKLDIKTEGLEVFNMLELIKELPQKLYSGAIVNYPENIETNNRALMQTIIAAIRELHKLLKIDKDFKKPDETLCSYDIAHHVGLSVNEEYEMLELLHENQRLEYIRRHIAKTIEVVTGVENLKDKIKLNGHFRELEGFDF